MIADITTFLDHSLGESMEALEILDWKEVRSCSRGMTSRSEVRVLGLNPSSAVY